MKTNILKRINTLLAGIISLLGFSCNGNTIDGKIDDGMIAMYGCPQANFEISGTVNNTTQEPIKNIQVIVTTCWNDTVFTDKDGKFISTTSGFPTDSVKITCHDIDGEGNGGTYASDSVKAKINYNGGDGKWNEGTGTAKVNITLKKKE